MGQVLGYPRFLWHPKFPDTPCLSKNQNFTNQPFDDCRSPSWFLDWLMANCIAIEKFGQVLFSSPLDMFFFGLQQVLLIDADVLNRLKTRNRFGNKSKRNHVEFQDEMLICFFPYTRVAYWGCQHHIWYIE